MNEQDILPGGMGEEEPEIVKVSIPAAEPSRRASARRGRTNKPPSPGTGAPMMGMVLSAEQVAQIAAAAARAVLAEAGIGGPKPTMVVSPHLADAELEDDNFDPLSPSVQAAARRNASRSRVPRAQGLSDAEVMSMFEAEDLGEFDIPDEIKQEGMAYGWKAAEVVQKPNASHMAEMYRRGWVPVTHEEFSGVFGLRSETGPIMRRGLMLMKRTAEIEELRGRYFKLVAKQAVRDKVAQMGQAPAGTGPRTHKDVQPRISRIYEPLPIE